ncbi:MAG: FlgO family outer membrane protein [Woeseiaceae bacterium]|nr:FlgO family outer membrane protein [Woeseiaceae bacterium]
MERMNDFCIGQFHVRPQRGCIESGGRQVRVKPKPMAVLQHLAAADGRVVSRDELFDAVWPGATVTDDVLTHCISELRKAFRDSARSPGVIETIPKVGFRLVMPVTPAAQANDTPPRWRLRVGGYAVAALAAAAIVIAIVVRNAPFEWRSTNAANAATVASVAVLPFVDMSAGQDEGYFADGLSEELINRLTQLDDLRVTGRTSSFYFRNRNMDVRDIGEQLSVRYVLEGSVRKSDERLRITAQLIDVDSGFHVWSNTFDRPPVDVFDVQEEIAEAVAMAMSISLSIGELGTIEGGTNNVAAFDALLKGNASHDQFNAETVMQAIGHYQRAIELDPEFGLAHGALANVYRNAWLVFGRDEYDEWAALADEAMARALSLAPTSPHVLTTAAYIHVDRLEWDEALRLLEQVEDLESSRYGSASMMYTDLLIKAGRAEEAVTINERGRLMDPLHSGKAMYLVHLYAMQGRYDDAVAELDRAWALGAYQPQLANEGLVLALSARDDDLLRKWLTRAAQHELPGANGIHAAMLEVYDDPDSALDVLRQAYASSTSTDYFVIVWAAYYRERDLALAAMQRSPDLWAFWLPVLADIRRLPAFVEIVNDTDLPVHWRTHGWGDFCRPMDGNTFECS